MNVPGGSVALFGALENVDGIEVVSVVSLASAVAVVQVQHPPIEKTV